jgi:hypothetical protein
MIGIHYIPALKIPAELRNIQDFGHHLLVPSAGIQKTRADSLHGKKIIAGR